MTAPRVPSVPIALVVSACVILGACSFVQDLEPLQQGAGGGSSTSSSSVGGGDPSSSSSSSSSSSTGQGGGGGVVDPCAPPVDRLTDCGLLARYYLDEAASGTAPEAALDAAPDPLDLPIEYLDGLTYAETAGHRGLRWPDAALDGGPSSALAGTKLFALDGATRASIEVVAEVDRASYFGTRLAHLGSGPESRLTIAVDTPWDQEGDPVIDLATKAEIRVDFGSELTLDFPLAFHELDRVVVHAVVDTTQDDETARLRLYLNGVEVTVGEIDGTLPAQGAALHLDAQDSIGLGNRAVGQRSPDGTLYYAAYYAHALTTDEIATHVDVLLASDDTPE